MIPNAPSVRDGTVVRFPLVNGKTFRDGPVFKDGLVLELNDMARVGCRLPALASSNAFHRACCINRRGSGETQINIHIHGRGVVSLRPLSHSPASLRPFLSGFPSPLRRTYGEYNVPLFHGQRAFVHCAADSVGPNLCFVQGVPAGATGLRSAEVAHGWSSRTSNIRSSGFGEASVGASCYLSHRS